jgi:hypothetical protein
MNLPPAARDSLSIMRCDQQYSSERCQAMSCIRRDF